MTCRCLDDNLVEAKKCEEQNLNLFQSKQKNRLQRKQEEFAKSFTVHGLTRVFKGSRFESLFWLGTLLGGILFSAIVIRGLAIKYLQYEVYTEFRYHVTHENLFPAVTICEATLLHDAYRSYCGVSPRIKQSFYNITCPHKTSKLAVTIAEHENKYWTNGLFNVTKCYTWGGTMCSNNKYFKSLKRFNNSCITWNFNGDLSDMYSHVELGFSFNVPERLTADPSIIAVIHDPNIEEVDIPNAVHLQSHVSNDIKLDKTIVKRLPRPYPSNCINETSDDIFPGKYSRHTCLDSNNYIEMFKTCGDTFDYAKQFVPRHIKKIFGRNRTIGDAERCIWAYRMTEAKKSTCTFPCYEIEYDVRPVYGKRITHENTQTFDVQIQYNKVDTYKIIEEKALYSSEQLACEIGGLIGLLLGASLISMIEIFAYVFLMIYNRIAAVGR